jgi:hypothetical protein
MTFEENMQKKRDEHKKEYREYCRQMNQDPNGKGSDINNYLLDKIFELEIKIEEIGDEDEDTGINK